MTEKERVHALYQPVAGLHERVRALIEEDSARWKVIRIEGVAVTEYRPTKATRHYLVPDYALGFTTMRFHVTTELPRPDGHGPTLQHEVEATSQGELLITRVGLPVW